MIGLILVAFAGQWQPPVAVTNSPAPPGVWYVSPAYPHSGPPMPPPAMIVRLPVAKAPLQALVTSDDYPQSALANREEGRVAMLLDISESGRVFACSVTRSSGSSALDSSSCLLVRRRARFTPAADSRGMPVAARAEGEIAWVLPSG